MKKRNGRNNNNEMTKNKKLVGAETNSLNVKKPRSMPTELINELFAALPLKNALGIMAKMPNELLARNVRKMLKIFKMAIQNNKWNVENCGPKLSIYEEGLIVKHSGPNKSNWVLAVVPIPKFIFNAKSIAIYFEVDILTKNPNWWDISIGFCTQQFPLEDNLLGDVKNSIGIYWKEEMGIDGVSRSFGNACGNFRAGDVIGLGLIHSRANSTTIKCFATCNGQLLGMAKLPAKFATLQLFPAVSLYSYCDSIHVNFGKDEWRFNPDQILQEGKK